MSLEEGVLIVASGGATGMFTMWIVNGLGFSQWFWSLLWLMILVTVFFTIYDFIRAMIEEYFPGLGRHHQHHL
ncbi:MAG: hypothetical protein HQL69_18285 [Magnetococcales bacterium]|nr:hypothetical protein [Magnetococcales bacterium]